MIRDFDVKKWDGSEIIIYGAGYDGELIANKLSEYGINKFSFCDSYKVGGFLLGKSIYDIDLLQNTQSNIILGSSKYYVDIYKILKKKGIEDERIYTAYTILSSIAHDLNTHDLKKVGGNFKYEASDIVLKAFVNNGWYLGHLDVVITEICTLKCEACSSLMPLYKTPHNCDRAVVIESLENLLKSKCYIACLCLMGGEPLLNQSLLQEILLKYKDEKQIGFFQVITNGTIVPSKETLKAMRENGRLYVIFSNYGKLSRKQDEAIDALSEYKIEFALMCEKDIKAVDNTLWINYGKVRHYDFSEGKHQKMFEECKDAKSCTTLMNGKLFICPRIAHGVNLGLIPENMPRCNVDLSNKALMGMNWMDIRQECIQYLFNTQYPLACEYCNRDAGILVRRAKQIEE